MSTKTKEYIRPMPRTWWLHNRYVFMFMLRELTSFFVAGYSIFLMVLLFKGERGEEVFTSFVDGLKSPLSVVLQLLTLVFVVYHSVTSFNAAPEIMVVRRGEDTVDPAIVVGANYVLWLIVTVVVLLLALLLPV